MRVWMIKVYWVVMIYRLDILFYFCDWVIAMYFIFILKVSLILVLVKEIWLYIIGNDLMKCVLASIYVY